jgi:dihydropteroate synthase
MTKAIDFANFRRVHDRPAVMGIVNVTPDSFSDGGQFLAAEQAIAHGLDLIAQGADLLDIGGESTRPGADPVSVEAEAARVLPVIAGLRARCEVPISIDTRKPDIAKRAMQAGANIWNDVSALGFAKNSGEMAAELDCPLILMHMLGAPKTMQEEPNYQDVVAEVIHWLQDRVSVAMNAGVSREKILVDPGIGFGKTPEHNLALLGALDRLRDETGCPVLLGASRKRFIAALDMQAVEADRLGGSLASIAVAFAQSVAMVRVHDVRQTVQMLRVLRAIQTGQVAS